MHPLIPQKVLTLSQKWTSVSPWVEVEEKVSSAGAFAEKVSGEKAKAAVENEAAQIEAGAYTRPLVSST